MTRHTSKSSCIGALAALALAGIAPTYTAHAQIVVKYEGEVTGSIGDMAFQGRIIVSDPPSREIPEGAHFTVETEGQQRFVRVRVTAPGSRFAPRGPDGHYGRNTVRIEMGFAMPASASDSDLTQDMLEFASLDFVEVWPTGVRTPTLQFNTMFNQPDLSLTTLEWGSEGIRLAGSVTGEPCLYVYHSDDDGHHSPTEARVLGETVCPAVALEFSTLARPFDG
ncbi:hypothetical protein [Glycocaulis sp.]|jgi:hypothetical protein|uniref:hypothetical protein n=1 Tax=Glycocaulis sp. TaxID=1969725 RepID=UPI0025BD645A|nr:hypothetical protein [Glycocaulis sp.]MCH8522903.1 hypothetical protein [Glycocaulis sp.]